MDQKQIESLNRRWVATSHQRVAAWDEVLDQLDAAIRERVGNLAAKLVQRVSRTTPAHRATAIQRVLDEAAQQVLAALADTLPAGREASATAFADAIPSGLVGDLLGRVMSEQRITESIELSDELAKITGPRPPSKRLDPQQAKRAIARLTLPPIKPAQLRTTFRDSHEATNTPPLVQRLSDQLWPQSLKLQIQSQLVTGLSKGDNVADLTKRVKRVTGSATYQARRVARTEGRRALERDHRERTADALGDMLQGYMIQAVLDDRTRPEHAARHGTIYNRQADGSFRDRAGRLMPDLPDQPNCRCTLVPVLKEPDLSEPDRRAFETATRDLVPDLPTYNDVWRSADTRTRRRMIGAARYDLLEQRFGAVDPSLALQANGRLVPLDELRTDQPSAAYTRRSLLLTRRALLGDMQQSDQAVGMSENELTARRVLARNDLPARMDPAIAMAEVQRLVPTPAATATARDVATAARNVVEQFTQMAANSPDLTIDHLRAEIWRVIRSDTTYVPRVTAVTPFSGAMDLRIQSAMRLVQAIVPRPLDVRIRVHGAGYRGNYNPSDRTVNIANGAPVETIVHEILHWVDHQYFNQGFGEVYAQRLSRDAIAVGSERYQMRRDRSPGLYYYQNREYGTRQNPQRGLEFITTMGEQLVRNPLLAIHGDPEGFELWLKTMRQLR